MGNILLGVLLLISSHCWAARLFVWQPSEDHVPVLIGGRDHQSAKDAAKNYLKAFNQEKHLVELAGPLKLPLVGLRPFYPIDSTKPLFIVIANKPSQAYGLGSSQEWYTKLVSVGAEAYVLPVNSDIGMTIEEAADYRKTLVKAFDAVLALGGEDVDPSIYTEKNRKSKNTNVVRDRSEAKVIEAFVNSEAVPCFGICRGMQLTSALLGYKLIQDIATETNNKHDHVFTKHHVTLVGSQASFFRGQFGEQKKIPVDSWHHQAVIADSKKNGPLALVGVHDEPGQDKIAEVMEFKNGMGFLVQFHPERMKTPEGQKIMSMMVKLAKKIKLESKKPAYSISCQHLFY
jgi:putative glutamine amidotransferase